MTAQETHAILIADLGYGDAGKGSLVDYLTRRQHAHTVVRYNGGAQAAHTVVTADGRWHTFAQFGSGSLLPGVRTHLSRFMLLHPLAMLAEERHLRAVGISDAFSRLSIERQAAVITPYQQAANRIRELARGQARHGSCGMGIGETQADRLAYGEQVPLAGDLPERDRLIQKLKFLRQAKLAQLESQVPGLFSDRRLQEELAVVLDADSPALIADVYTHLAAQIRLVEGTYLGELLRQPGTIIFEGAQGVLLDEWWGFYPYNSWSTLTFQHADTLLAENNFSGKTLKLGLTRAYTTRHGAGPFVAEDARLSALLPDLHNRHNPWQTDFRVGHLDLPALRYARQVSGPIDGLVVTNLDRLQAVSNWQFCTAYRHPAHPADLEAFLIRDQDTFTDIRVPADPTDLVRQARLTQLLLEMQPVLSPAPRQIAEYVEAISQALGLPLLIISQGPAAEDKTSVLLDQYIRPPQERQNRAAGRYASVPAPELPGRLYGQ